MASYQSSFTGAEVDDGVSKARAALPVDATLTATGKAADAKAVGDAIKNCIQRGDYIASSATLSDINNAGWNKIYSVFKTGSSYPAHMPTEKNGILITSNSGVASNSYSVQMFIADDGSTFVRYCSTGTNFTPWQGKTEYGINVTATSTLSDLNSAAWGKIYNIFAECSNRPVPEYGTLITIGSSASNNYLAKQIYISHSGALFTRFYTGSTFGGWQGTRAPAINVTATSTLSDLDNAGWGKTYNIYAACANRPTDENGTLITIGSNASNNYLAKQFYVTHSGNLYTRFYTGSQFGRWASGTRRITCGQGQMYATFKAALAAANEYKMDLEVFPGVYDLVAEGVDTTTAGLWVGVNIYGHANAIIKAELDNWSTVFSVLNLGRGENVTIEGLTLIADKCRYVVHDDNDSTNYANAKHVYKNCHFIHETAADSTWASPSCIGGGLGANAFIEIENCVFESVYDRSVYYHTDVHASGIKSNVICTNSVFKNGYIQFTTANYKANEINDVFVSNCKLKTAPTASDRFNLTAWNNVIDT